MFFISAWQHSRDSASIWSLPCLEFRPGSTQEFLQTYGRSHVFYFSLAALKRFCKHMTNFHVFNFSPAALKRLCKHMTNFMFFISAWQHSRDSASIWPLSCFLVRPGSAQEMLHAYGHCHVFYFSPATLKIFCKHMTTFLLFISAWQHSRDSEILQAYDLFHAF